MREVSSRRGPGRPRDPLVDEAIETAAWQVLEEQGPRRVSPERVADRAGVAVSTVYRRYRTGDDILVELMGRTYDTGPFPDTGSLREDLAQLLAGAARVMEPLAPRRALAVALLAAVEDNPAVCEARELAMKTRREEVTTIVERAVARGELPEDLDATTMLDLISGFATHRMLMVREPLTPEIIESVLDIVLHGATRAS